jgi:hypothetical protein
MKDQLRDYGIVGRLKLKLGTGEWCSDVNWLNLFQ